MAKQPEVRLSQTAVIAIIAILAVAMFGAFNGWFDKAAPTTPTGNVVVGDDGKETIVPLSVVPAIEKTKIYVSGYDLADFEGENQKNLVAGTADVIKSGNVLETVTTSASTGVATTAEFNGGDKVIVLATASGYYANDGTMTVDETLKPIEIAIADAATPDVYVNDDNGNELTSGNITLDTNDVSKTHTIVIERPGDDTFYQFCGIGADFDDDYLDVRVKVGTSFTEGTSADLDAAHDALDVAGIDKVWDINMPISNFDSIEIPFVIGTAKDVDPSAKVVSFHVYDCEKNLQSGKIVYTNEDAADADVGLANIVANITIN